LLNLIVTRTDGIPLFIEELVDMLQHKKLVRHLNGITDFVSADKINEVPGSLRDSLQQKLDTLLYAKETVQLAATIGREFDYELLACATNHNQSQLQNDLNELVGAELVFLQRKVAGDSYIFKHALVRDAAYEGMLNPQLQQNHRQIANALVNNFPEQVKDSPLMVAQHFAGGQQYAQATKLGIEAVQKLANSSANEEAVSVSDAVMGWTAKIQDNYQCLETQLLASEAVLPAQLSLTGYGSEQVYQIGLCIQNNREQMAAINTESHTETRNEELDFKVDWILFLAAHYKPRRAESISRGEALLARCQKNNNRQQVMTVMFHLAQAYSIAGQLTKANPLYEQAYAMYDPKLDYDLAKEYGTDAKSQNLSLSAIDDLSMGQIDTAYAKLDEALQHAEEIGHQVSIIFACIVIAMVASFVKDYDKVLAITKQYELKHGDKQSFFTCYLYLYYYCVTGDSESAKKALDEQIATGQLFAISYYATHLVDLYLRQDRIDEATQLMEQTLNRAIEHENGGSLPFLKKTMAQCYYASDKKLSDRVKQMLTDAIDDAQSQQAHYYELENRVYLWTLDQADDGSDLPFDSRQIAALLDKVSIQPDSPLYLDVSAMIEALTTTGQ
ncbi:MAG: hypothetical protein MJK04_37165, partial [Psychrosphaera sp.]|nr:hypothetical protein [Psychrosphaera sp.]